MRKVFTVMLTALLVILPTLAGLIIYFLPEDATAQQVAITGSFYDGEAVKFDFTRTKNATLCTFLDTLEENSLPSSADASSLKYDKLFYADIAKGDVERKITLYLSGSGYSYYSEADGKLRRISATHAQQLLSSPYAVSLFESVNTPTLTTYSGEVVLPRERSFKYILGDGITTKEGNGTPTSSEVRTYYSSKTGIFNFSKKPDICNVKAYVGGELAYDGPLYEFSSSALPSGEAVRFDIDATWIKGDETSKFFGTASYSFSVVYSPAPSFRLTATSCVAGDMIALKASNVRDPSLITLSSPDGIGDSVRFFKYSNNYYALIPTDIDLDPGKYKLTLRCGETSQSFEISVEERKRDVSSTVYESSVPVGEEQISAMLERLSKIGSICSEDTGTAGKSFINYELAYADKFTLKLGYGRVRSFSDGGKLDMIGIEFYSDEGVSVPVINDGTVCAVGEDAILGRYVVVDHGCGLKSWYCNLSSVTAELGAHLERGDTVARTGSSACYGQSGFYLTTTVLDSPVSPYSVYENGFTLFN